MKLTKEQKDILAQRVKDGDNEAVHGRYDDLIHDRLEELDPEFIKEIDDLVKDIEFWYS
jgi:hypothetical protein